MEENIIDAKSKLEQINEEINGLKQLLKNSDYKAIKYAEGEISDVEYAPTRKYRQELRDKINALELDMQE